MTWLPVRGDVRAVEAVRGRADAPGMDLTPRRRRALSTALAILLAIESVTVVAAAAHTSVTPRGPHPLPEGAPAGLVLAD